MRFGFDVRVTRSVSLIRNEFGTRSATESNREEEYGFRLRLENMGASKRRIQNRRPVMHELFVARDRGPSQSR